MGSAIPVPSRRRVGARQIVGSIACVTREVVQAELGAEALPLTVGYDPQEELRSVSGLEYIVYGPRRYPHGHRLCCAAGDRLLSHVLTDQIDARLKKGAADLLAVAARLALEQRGEYRDDGKHPTGDIDYGCAGTQGTSGRSSHAGQPAHHLRHFIEGRALFVRARQKAFLRTIDQAGILVTQRFVIEAQTVESPGAKVLEQHILQGDQATGYRQVASSGVLQMPRGVSGHRLDADHLGTQFRENGPSGRSHDHVGQFDDFEARQGLRLRR
jgi:hypothetical protein